LLVAIAGGLAIVAALLLFQAQTAHGAAQINILAIDTDPSSAPANTAISLGTIETCKSFATAANQTFDIDVVVDSVPSPGVAAAGITLLYNPAVLKVLAVDDHQMLLQAPPMGFIINYGEATPDNNGMFEIDPVNFSGGLETGAGVLTRITMQVVGTGVSTLDITQQSSGGLGNPQVLDAAANKYSLGTVQGAGVGVGSPCPAPPVIMPTPTVPPTPVPSLTTTVTPQPSPATPTPIIGLIGRLAIDADPTSSPLNTPTAIGSTETCKSFATAANQTFDIDVVVDSIPSPGAVAFELDLLYNPAVLKVTGLNEQLLLLQNPPPGTILNFGDATPDTDGDFHLAAINHVGGYETGAGVLARITLQVVGAGVSTLDIAQDPSFVGKPQILQSGGAPFRLGAVRGASVGVGSPCPPPPIVVYTPTPVPPTPSPSPTPNSAVGGIVGLTVSSSGSPFPSLPLAAVASSVIVMAVMGAGLWYGRRRSFP
jgi:hypothetical protein